MNSTYSKKYIKYKSKYLYLKQYAGDSYDEIERERLKKANEIEKKRYEQQQEYDKLMKELDLILHTLIIETIMKIYNDFIKDHAIQPTDLDEYDDKYKEVIKYDTKDLFNKYNNDTSTQMINKFDRWFFRAYMEAYVYKESSSPMRRLLAILPISSSPYPSYNINQFYKLIENFKKNLQNKLNDGLIANAKIESINRDIETKLNDSVITTELKEKFKNELNQKLNNCFITARIINNDFIKYIITLISSEEIKKLYTYYDKFIKEIKNKLDGKDPNIDDYKNFIRYIRNKFNDESRGKDSDPINYININENYTEQYIKDYAIKESIMQIYNDMINKFTIKPNDPPYSLSYPNIEDWIRTFQVIKYNRAYPLNPYFSNDYNVMINRFNNWYNSLIASIKQKIDNIISIKHPSSKSMGYVNIDATQKLWEEECVSLQNILTDMWNDIKQPNKNDIKNNEFIKHVFNKFKNTA